MREGWKEEKLGCLVTTKKGFAFKSSWYQNTGVPVVRVSDFTESSISVESVFYVNENIAYQNRSVQLKEKDIIVQTVGSWQHNPASIVGKVVRVPLNLDNSLLNQNAVKLIPNEKVDKDFLYFRLKEESFKYHNLNYAQGAANQASITLETIKSFKFLLPPLETQRKIAKILSNYDDLIENNLKRIKILEEMAQQTFRNFVKNGSAKNWESKSLETLIDFHIGGGWGEEEFSNEFSETGYVIRGTDIDSLKKGENSKVPYRFHKISNIKSRQLEDGDIVFEVSGGSSNEGVAKSFLITSEVLQFFNDKVICASFCKLIRLKDRSLSHFFYYFLQYLRESKTTEIYEKRSASNIVNYNWEAFLKYQKILLPNPNEIKEFNDKVVKILKLTNLLGAKNQRLREARDILLPRLMMGLVDVHDIDL